MATSKDFMSAPKCRKMKFHHHWMRQGQGFPAHVELISYDTLARLYKIFVKMTEKLDAQRIRPPQRTSNLIAPYDTSTTKWHIWQCMGHILIILSRNVSFKQKISTKTQKVAGVRIVQSLRHELEGHRVDFSPGSRYSEGNFKKETSKKKRNF